MNRRITFNLLQKETSEFSENNMQEFITTVDYQIENLAEIDQEIAAFRQQNNLDDSGLKKYIHESYENKMRSFEIIKIKCALFWHRLRNMTIDASVTNVKEVASRVINIKHRSDQYNLFLQKISLMLETQIERSREFDASLQVPLCSQYIADIEQYRTTVSGFEAQRQVAHAEFFNQINSGEVLRYVSTYKPNDLRICFEAIKARINKMSMDLAFRIAVSGGFLANAKFLLDYGADIHACGEASKRTALHLAVIHGQALLVQMLLDALSQNEKAMQQLLDAKDAQEKTPIEYLDSIVDKEAKIAITKLMQDAVVLNEARQKVDHTASQLAGLRLATSSVEVTTDSKEGARVIPMHKK